MLFHLQLPFTDLRPLSAPPTPRIKVPSWPTPSFDDREFVRAFGTVRRRDDGGLKGIGEAAYCDARRALRFPPGALDRPNGSANPAHGIALRAAFRRLFFDGFAAGKLEVGLCPTNLSGGRLAMADLLTHVLKVRAAVRTTDAPHQAPPRTKEYPLGESSQPLARFYALATSHRVVRSAGKVVARHELQDLSLFVRGEAPMVFIELSAAEAERIDLPSDAREISVAGPLPFSLLFWRRTTGDRTITVWCAVVGDPAARAGARSLRIYLLRLNAEHQALKRTLKAMAQGHIAPIARSEESERLQTYLNDATRVIGTFENKTKDYAEELGALAFSVFDVAAPGEREALLRRLEVIDVRPNIFRKVADYAKQQPVHITYVERQNNIETEGDVIVSEKGDAIKVDRSVGVVAGASNVQQTISNVQQTIGSQLTNVQQSIGSIPGAKDEDRETLKNLIEQLNAALKEGLEKAGTSKNPNADAVAENAEAVAAQATSLIETAAKENPNNTMLKTIAGGLKTTAEFLKDAIPSAVTIAAQIASVVGKIFGLPL